MVLPLVDEHRPKCYLCHAGFDNIEELRDHQNKSHSISEQHGKEERKPAPGDVTVF